MYDTNTEKRYTYMAFGNIILSQWCKDDPVLAIVTSKLHDVIKESCQTSALDASVAIEAHRWCLPVLCDSILHEH